MGGSGQGHHDHESAEDIVETIRSHALPESWGRGEASIQVAGGLLVVRQTPEGHEAVDKTLALLRAVAR